MKKIETPKTIGKVTVFELSGITLPPGNRCCRETCKNDACTALWESRVQLNLCGWHLKKTLGTNAENLH